jgi:hypothetical protein
MGFYDLSEDERVALTNAAISENRTVMERWGTLVPEEFDAWSTRTPMIARMLEGCVSVADVGCGFMGLKRFLAPETRYVPVDVVSRGEGTIVVDLNREPMPPIDVEAWAMAGLIEYILDVPALLASLSGVVVVSYNAVDLCPAPRRQHAWVNDFSVAEVEAMFADAGFVPERREVFGYQMIWRFRRLTD